MIHLVHVSDLHFGRARPELVWPLIAQLNALAADLIIISGDLTQRAHRRQFRAARAFMRRLEAPVMVIPGNHEIPAWNLPARILCPFRRYRRWISSEREPVFEHADARVIGLNTVNPWVWQCGRIGGEEIRHVCLETKKAAGAVRVVVAHHPLQHQPGDVKALMSSAAGAIDAFAECGVDVILAGHLHSWRAELLTGRAGGRRLIQVLAGTGLSTRLRGGVNDFNLLTVGTGQVIVERYAAEAGGTAFRPAQRVIFRTGSAGWQFAKEDGAGG